MDNIIEVISIAKYVVGGIGVIGIILAIVGAFNHQRELIQKGILLFITSVVLFICGYFIIRTTTQRVEQEMELYYEQMQRQM